MTVQAAPSSLERELEYRKKLTAITNQINAAESIPQILMTLKDRILELLERRQAGNRLAPDPARPKNEGVRVRGAEIVARFDEERDRFLGDGLCLWHRCEGLGLAHGGEH